MFGIKMTVESRLRDICYLYLNPVVYSWEIEDKRSFGVILCSKILVSRKFGIVLLWRSNNVRPCIGYQSILFGMCGCLTMCFVNIWVLTKQIKNYWRSYMGHLKRYPFLKSAYFQEWGQDLGDIRPCIGYQSVLFGMCKCLRMCFVHISVLTKQK